MNRPLPQPAPVQLDRMQIRAILIGIVLAMLLGALDQTIVVTALPTIGRELNDVENLSWVVTAYLLTSTAVTPIYGKLSDINGRRLMLLIAITIFLAGSVACAVAPNILALIMARGLQGLGGGGLISLGVTIIGDIIAPRERGRYQAFFASVFVTSSIAGPILGGFFAEYLHWSFIFWINLPLGIAALYISNRVLRLLPVNHRPHRIDIPGALLMMLATVSLVLAMSWGGSAYAWSSPVILALLGGSVVAWVLFAARLVSTPEPFIPLGILANGVVRNAVFAAFFAVGAMIGLTVYVPLYFEAVVGLSAGQSGIALVAFMGGTVLGGTIAGRIMAVFAHYKWVAVLGQATAAAATLAIALWAPDLGFYGIEALLFAGGIGLGTIFPITTTSIQNAVQPHQMGTATGVLNFARSIGGAIIVAVFGAIFLASVIGHAGSGSIQTIIHAGREDGTDFGPVFTGVFLAAAACYLIGFVFMVLMEERPLRGKDAPPAAAPGGDVRR